MLRNTCTNAGWESVICVWKLVDIELALLSLQVSPAATLDKLKESLRLYMEECELNNSRDALSTGELKILM